MGTFPYHGGVPTRPDVDKLVAKFGVPKDGDVIAYTDIEAELGYKRHTARWVAVIGSWKRRLYRESNVFFETVNGTGYRCAPGDTRISHSVRKVRHGMKRIVKGGELAASTSDQGLSSDQQRSRDHIISVAGKLAALAHQQTRTIGWKF